MDGPIQELADDAAACARHLLDADGVVLASHIDADGLTSAAVAASAMERTGVPFETVFAKQLDDAHVDAIATHEYDTAWFTDFGSGQLDAIATHDADGDFTAVIADHHKPADTDRDVEHHVNPLRVGLNGATELSGAGTTYAIARAMGTVADVEMRDLAALAVVGAVGDMQAKTGELVGANRAILAEGIDVGVLAETTDLAVYGTQTRPLPKLLEYADIDIPGVTNDANGALRFLDALDVDLVVDGEWRRWVDIDHADRQTIVRALVKRAVRHGVPSDDIDRLVGTTYELCDEPEGTPLRNASEYATLLNATARYDRADVGLAVCLGDRGAALDRADRLLGNHRGNLSAGISWVQETGVERETNLQWFHAEDRLRETIVGIVAGMAMGTPGVDRNRPIIAFAYTDDGDVKVSARGTDALVRRGLDLSAVMSAAAATVDGEGGGHDIAAGASIPLGKETEFVAAADRLVGEQLDS